MYVPSIKIEFIALNQVLGSARSKTAVIVNTEDGSEKIAKSIVDNGVSNSSFALETTSCATVRTNDYDFTIIYSHDDDITTLTGTVLEVDADVSTTGLLEDYTIFNLTGYNTVTSNRRAFETKDIIRADEDEFTLRGQDIAAISLGSDLGVEDDLNLYQQCNEKSVVSSEKSLSHALDSLLGLTSNRVVSGHTPHSSLMEVATNYSIYNTARAHIFNLLSTIRNVDSELAVGDTSFTFGELRQLASYLPPVVTNQIDMSTGDDLNKDISMVSNKVISALKMITTISLIIDLNRGTHNVGNSIIYAPGIREIHTTKLIANMAIEELKGVITELSILTYGLTNGNVVATITKSAGEPVIDIKLSNDFGRHYYKIRDNSSFYTTLLTNKESHTLADSSILTNNVLENISK